MGTLKLKSTPVPPGQGRAPLRGAGVQARPTLAQAQAQRAQRQAPPEPTRPPAIQPTRPPTRPPERPPERPPQRPPTRPVDPPSARSVPPHKAKPAPRAAPPWPAEARAPSPQAPAVVHPPDAIRLSKRMTELKLASRREADEWIEAGWVMVNGLPAVLGQRVRPGDRIEVDPAARDQQARKLTVLINKPIGYVSGQAEDGYEPAVVLVTADKRWADDRGGRFVASRPPPGLAPAGRLDIDSTGLLVLTQDGRIARHLIGDDSDVEKEYLVRVAPLPGGPRDNAIALLGHGLELDGVKLRPARISWANEDQLRVVLREGRKRQIRRMCELVGYQVTGLKRVRIGSVVLGKLPLGQWRLLRDDERF